MKTLVMLGNSGVGKTTYMASLYGEMQREVEGLCLLAINHKDHQNWIHLSDAIRRGHYPLPTDQRNEYEFKLHQRGVEKFHFLWSDYRGESIIHTQDNPQTRSLIDDLCQSEGMMLFCDSTALAEGKSRVNQIARMVNLVSTGLQDHQRALVLSIVLTKVDQVDEFTNAMIMPFMGLIEAIVVGNIPGAFIPVACGKRVINIPLPLLFTAQRQLLQMSSPFVNLQGVFANLPIFQAHCNQADYVKKLNLAKQGISLRRSTPGLFGTPELDPFNAF